MRFEILTLFPDLVRPYLGGSMLGRAARGGLVDFQVTDIRDYAHDRHKTCDDSPFGGGQGMVMKAEPVLEAIEDRRGPDTRTILLSPGGSPFNQAKARELAACPDLLLVCGRYEGLDQRIVDLGIDEEICVGDYVLTGGELPALIVVDAVSRLIPGVLGNAASAVEESFENGLLEYPHYTRPRSFRGLDVPEVLLSGDHARIAAWRREQAIRRTRERRPDLISDEQGGMNATNPRTTELENEG